MYFDQNGTHEREREISSQGKAKEGSSRKDMDKAYWGLYMPISDLLLLLYRFAAAGGGVCQGSHGYWFTERSKKPRAAIPRRLKSRGSFEGDMEWKTLRLVR